MQEAATLVAKADGRCAISGQLTLETVPALWRQLKADGLLRNAREADLSAVTDADSAGLALLVTWRAHCAAAGGALALMHLPGRILALARLTSAEAALGA